MNIFHIHEDPKVAASAMTDKHVIKMILESAQLLSTAHRVLDGEEYTDYSKNNRKIKRWNHPKLHDVLYKSTHVNHPSTIWCRESKQNYIWLYNHFISLCDEYTKRYNKIHSVDIRLREVLKELPKNIPNRELTEFRCAISNKDYIVESNPIQSYINYYIGDKLKTDKDKERFYKIINE